MATSSSDLTIPDLKALYFERELHPEEELWAVLARLGWVGPTPAGVMRDALHHAEVRVADLETAAKP